MVLLFLVVAILILPAYWVFEMVVANYTSDSIYECSGVMTKTPDKSSPITIFVKITQYSRLWVYGNPLDGLLRLEIQSTTGPHIPTTPDHNPGDDPPDRLWALPGDSFMPVRPFPGFLIGQQPYAIREDLFGFISHDDYLFLYRWPKAGETIHLAGPSQGRFSTISNSLEFTLSDESAFNGKCKPK
jgi:hypothetical protein